ncbi:MAG: ROK family protein, partial [Deltaproteobacteria bacterium]|nr:ROK family protein [Deltaproteobacteria bacterium]
GVYLGYALAHFLSFYDFRNLLVLGRVTSGKGGDLMLEIAQQVLKTELPDRASTISFVTPDEQMKRHGQAIAAASLPAF